MTQIALAAVASFAIASLAYAFRALSPSGAVAAFAIGTIVFAIGGWPAAAVLLAFFISASLLSRIGVRRKRGLVDWGKQGARDARQVLANGGVAAACLALSPFVAAPLLLAFAAALAAATADTWATEIGTLARRARSVLTFRPISSGISGGVSVPGTIAQLGGAAFVAYVGYAVHLTPFWPVAIAGVVGSLFDSVLGGSVQALRWCPACARPCETNPHVCGTPTTMFRGLSWVDNDAVNFLSTLVGASVAVLVARHWPSLW
ncbi:MAG: DUF92 domain-containing protein [Candidatus Tyrphobacter sp.]